MPGDNMFLYWGSGSIPCWKAMLALTEKGLNYKNKLLQFSKKEHKSAEIMALNPRGQLPTFKDGNVVVNESNAIIEYVESEYPNSGTKLLPTDKEGKGKVLQVFHELANMHGVLVDGLIHYKMFTPKEKINDNELATRYDACRKEMLFWDTKLEKNGPYIAGPKFSMADCVAFPYLAISKRLGMKLYKWPHVDGYYNHMLDRPSVKATWPPHWKETPGNTSLLEDV